MNDQQLIRYSRHILLDEIGVEGQQRLIDANVLTIGLGRLGNNSICSACHSMTATSSAVINHAH